MIGQQVYYMVLSLVVGALSARYLGPSNYGLLNYGTSIISFFTIVSKLGLDGVIINEMIKRPEKRGSFLGSALVARLLVSIVSVGMVMVIVNALEPDNEALQIVTLLQSFVIIMQSYEVLTYWFQMNLKMKYVSIATMIAQTVVVGWRILLLVLKASVNWFALSASIQFFVCGIVVAAFFLKEKDVKLKFSINDASYLIKNSYHFIISGLAVVFYMQIGKVMIGKFFGNELVGIYTAATVIAAMWEFVPNAIINSARPLIMEQKSKDENKYLKQFQILLLGITVLAIIVGIAVLLLGNIAIKVLYGAQYMAAAIPLSILIWSTGFAIIGTARGVWIVSEGLNQYTKYYIFMGAIFNFALNFIFIPKWGIVGAAITTLLSQIFVAFVAPLFFKKTRVFVKIYFDSLKLFPELVTQIRTRLGKR